MEKKKIITEMVPSEKGWAYVICVGYTLIITCSMAVGNSMGLIFNHFIKEFGGSPSALTSIHGCTGIVIALSGLLVPFVNKWYSLRKISLFAAACLTLCWFCGVFINKSWHMYLTYSFLHGVGWGIFILIANMMFNRYFVKKRVMFMSICMAVVGIANIFTPYMIEYFLREYGYKGTAALLGAITLHSVVGSALFQPVEWHLIPKVIDDFKDQETPKRFENDKIEPEDQKNSLIKSHEDNILDIENKIVANITELNSDRDSAKDLHKVQKLELIIEKDDKMSIWSKVISLVDFSLYRELSFVNVNLAMTFGIFTDLQFYILLPLLLLEYNFTKIEAATCISITSIADLVSKILLIIVGRFFRVKSIYLCYFSLIVTLIGRIIFLQFNTFLGVTIMTALLGFSRGCLYVSKPLMCAEILPIERFAPAFSLTMVTTGLINGSVSPLIGTIRDYTGSFQMPFYFLTLLSAIPVLPWTFELFIMKKKRKRKS